MTAQPNFCPQCGSARSGALRFCATCGFDYWKAADPATATLDPGAGPTSAPSPVAPGQNLRPAAPAPAVAEKKNRRVGCIALAVIAVVVIAIFASLGGDPDATGDATATPEPNESEPSNTPTGQPSEAPASTAPTVLASAIASLEPEPAFEPIQLSGTGNAVPRFEIPADSAAIANIAHTGASNFAVSSIGESGEQLDLLVNVIGNYAGTVLFDEAAGSHSVAFDVQADGAWTIEIRPVTDAFQWDGGQALAGAGDDVAILSPPSDGLTATTLTHQGDGNFAIWAYGPSTDLIVNEIGPYSGEVLLPSGTFLFEISANGPWTISPPR